MVNDTREKAGLPKLKLVLSSLVFSSKQDTNIINKISSSTTRQYISSKSRNETVDLYAEWCSLMKDLEIKEQIRERWWSKLRDLYSEHWRFYHTLHHIYNLLQIAHKFKHLIHNLCCFKLAAWFHDAIYIPTNNNNEIVKLCHSYF